MKGFILFCFLWMVYSLAFTMEDQHLLKKDVKADGTSLFYQYDSAGRMKEIWSSDHSVHYIYELDDQGQILCVQDLIHGQNTYRTYQNGLLTSETLANGLQLSYSYDSQGRKKQVFLPDGSQILYTYQDNLLKSVEKLDSTSHSIYKHHYLSYDQEGRLLRAKMIGNAGEIEYSYSTGSLPKTILAAQWKEVLSEENGFISLIAIQDHQGPYSTEYSYDDQGQLINESGPCCNSFGYDDSHNRVRKNSSHCILNSHEQLEIIDNTIFSYDLNGNRVFAREGGDSPTLYEYDALDRLIKVSKEGKFSCSFTYDCFHRRMSKTYTPFGSQKSQSWSYIYQGDQEIGAIDSGKNLVELRILGVGYGAEIGAAIAIELEGQVFAPIHDHRGNVVTLIDPSDGSVFEYCRYSAFGEELLTGDSLINPWRFSSKRIDDVTNFVYFGKRYFDPKTGLWLTKDPLGSRQGGAGYIFLEHNPLSKVDLYGLFSIMAGINTLIETGKHYYQSLTHTLDSWRYSFQKDLSFHTYIESHIEALSLQMFGPSFLQFAGFYKHQPVSGIYGTHELDHNIKITFMNGILTGREELLKNLELFSSSHGDNKIHYVFHPTEGWTQDLFNCLLTKAGFLSTHAELMAHTWSELIKEMGGVEGDGKIIHYAHSIGAVDSFLARQLLTPEEQQKIHLITLGSPTVIPNTGFGHVINYVSMRDGIYFCDPIGFFGAIVDPNPNSNVVYLGSFLGVPLVDHLLFMDTYLNLVKKLGEEFVNQAKS